MSASSRSSLWRRKGLAVNSTLKRKDLGHRSPRCATSTDSTRRDCFKTSGRRTMMSFDVWSTAKHATLAPPRADTARLTRATARYVRHGIKMR
jgi:hypothetical protein